MYIWLLFALTQKRELNFSCKTLCFGTSKSPLIALQGTELLDLEDVDVYFYERLYAD